ncbi:MAG: recombination mediator RecR [Planctomycetota bacterium]
MPTSRTRTSQSPERRGYPGPVERLIAELSGLPGIGPRSAERLAFHLLRAPEQTARDLAGAIAAVKRAVRHCSVCANLTEDDPCTICRDGSRDRSTVLVVEQPKDLIAIEQSGMYRGVYHVLLGRLSPLEGIGRGDLTIDELFERLAEPTRNPGHAEITELVLGLNPTIEGDGTTQHLVRDLAPFQKRGLRVTRLARGLPTGASLELTSKAVLADAIAERRAVDEPPAGLGGSGRGGGCWGGGGVR